MLITPRRGFFSDFQYGFRPSPSTADLLTVASGRIVCDFNITDATQAVALDILKALDMVWYTGLLHKLQSFGISLQVFGLFHQFSIIDNFARFSILSHTFLLYINDLPDDVICKIAIYVDTILYSKSEQASDLWQQLVLASELKCDLRDTLDWDINWLDGFNAAKTKLRWKKVVLFLQINQVKIFLSLTHPHSWICIRIYIFNFEKQTNKQKKTRMQKKQKTLKNKGEHIQKID